MSDYLGDAVVENLARADVKAEVNFHGAVDVVAVPDKEQLVTGYSSWNYGQVYVLHDNAWEECSCGDEGHHYTPSFSDDDGLEDPVVIAQGIVRFINGRRNQQA